MYTTTAEILEMLGHKINTKGQKKSVYPMEPKIKATWAEVCQLTEQQKHVTEKEFPKNTSNCPRLKD